MNNWFTLLPDELIHRVAFYLPLNNIKVFCLICNRFDKLVCNNNLYWNQRFILDIGIPSCQFSEQWRDVYRNFGELIILRDSKQYNNIKAKKISCGGQNTMILDVNNNIYFNKLLLSFHGAKGIACGNTIQLFIDTDHNVWSFENEAICLIKNLKAKYVTCGDGHAIFIDLNDQIWVLGNNDFGQCGISTELNYISLQKISDLKIKFVSCGNSHTVIIDMEDNIWVFGDNEYGQLGLGDLTDRHEPTLLTSLLKGKSASCGYGHTLIIDLNDNIWVFGDNQYGQLGLGDTDNRLIPFLLLSCKVKSVSCGDHHSVITDLDDNIFVFGRNHVGQLGKIENKDILIPTPYGRRGYGISCGNDHTAMILF